MNEMWKSKCMWPIVAMISEGYKLKIALTPANKMTLCVFSCLGSSQIPQKNSVYPRNSGGLRGGLRTLRPSFQTPA